jgi:hypothetical protein
MLTPKSNLNTSEKSLLEKSKEGFMRASIIHQLEGNKEVSGAITKFVNRHTNKVLKPSDPDLKSPAMASSINTTGMPVDPKTIRSLARKGFLKPLQTLNIRAWGNNRDVEEFEFK